MNSHPTLEHRRLAPHWLLLSSLFFFCLGVYANSLNGGFKWDDIILIKDNYTIKTWSNAADAFLKPLHGFPAYWRPLQTISYRLDYSFWKLNPLGYHLTSVLLHLVNTLLVYCFIFLVTGNKRGSWIAAALFACHPALAEPVNYISSRPDLLVAMFILAVFIFYILSKTDKRKIFLPLSLFSFCLALLSKEVAFIVPWVLLAQEALFTKRYKKTYPYILIAFAFFVLRQALVPLKTFHAFSPTLLLSVPKAFLSYSIALVFPANLHKSWHISPVASGIHADFILSVVGIGLLGMLVKKTCARSKPALFGIIWFILILLPFSTLLYLFCKIEFFPFSYAWLYTPAIGAFLFVASLLAPDPGPGRKAARIIFPAVIALFSFATMNYNATWAGSEMDFYKDTLKHQPDLAVSTIYTNMGRSFMEEKKYDEALNMLNKALLINPRDTVALCDIGMTYELQKRYKEAREVFEKVLKWDGQDTRALFGIGLILTDENKLDEALLAYKKALAIDPNNSKIRYNVGLIYARKNNEDAALNELQGSVRLDPDNIDAHYNLAILYARKNDLKNALKECAIVTKTQPQAFKHQ